MFLRAIVSGMILSFAPSVFGENHCPYDNCANGYNNSGPWEPGPIIGDGGPDWMPVWLQGADGNWYQHWVQVYPGGMQGMPFHKGIPGNFGPGIQGGMQGMSSQPQMQFNSPR